MSKGEKITRMPSLTVEIDDLVYRKIMYWVDKAEGEVSGLGKVVVDETTGKIRVVEAILLPQENGAASTEIKGDDVGKAMFLMKDTPGTLRFWWHSHVNMDVFWSGTDLDTIAQISSGGWFVSTVFNKKRELLTCYSQINPVPFLMNEVNTTVARQIPVDVVKQWDEDFTKNCKNKTFASSATYGFADDEMSIEEYFKKKGQENNTSDERSGGFGDFLRNKHGLSRDDDNGSFAIDDDTGAINIDFPELNNDDSPEEEDEEEVSMDFCRTCGTIMEVEGLTDGCEDERGCGAYEVLDEEVEEDEEEVVKLDVAPKNKKSRSRFFRDDD